MKKSIKIQLDEELIGRLKVYAYLHNMRLGDAVTGFLMNGLDNDVVGEFKR